MVAKDKTVSNSSAVQKFEEEMKLRHFTLATIRTYRLIVSAFLRAVNKPVSELCSEDIRSYLLASIERKLSWSSVNQKVYAIRIFSEVCLGIGVNKIVIPPRKSEKKVISVLSKQDIFKILNAAEPGLEKTLLLFIYATGARGFEAAKLHVSDIQSDRMLIRLSQGKGRKDRLVPLSPHLLLSLREYYRDYRPGQWLFPKRKKESHIDASAVAAIWNCAKRKAGITTGGVHSLRHAFATNLLEQGVDVYSLQQILGHTNILSTARYLRMTNTISLSVGGKIDGLLKKIV